MLTIRQKKFYSTMRTLLIWLHIALLTSYMFLAGVCNMVIDLDIFIAMCVVALLMNMIAGYFWIKSKNRSYIFMIFSVINYMGIGWVVMSLMKDKSVIIDGRE